MLSQSQLTRIRLFQVCDGALFAFCLAASYFLRAASSALDLPVIEPFEQHLWMFPVIAFVGPAMLASQGFYRRSRITSSLNTIFALLRGITFTTIALVLILFILRLQLARSVIIFAGGFAGLAVYLRDVIFSQLSARGLTQSPWRNRVLWVGTAEENSRLRALLTMEERDQIESVSQFDPSVDPPEQFVPLLHDYAINAVIINLAGLETTKLKPVLDACAREGVAVVVRPGLLSSTPLGLSIDWFAGEPVIHYRAHKAAPGHILIKHAIDFVAATILLILLAPVFLLVALAIKFTSRGPIFFKQSRAGVNGRPFTMLKFRSMKAGAELEKASLAPLNEMTGPVFKLTNDPRITPVGRFLRRHSLDELPQFWNVFRGEMSLVGPRPLPISEVKQFSDDAHRRRLSVRPGLTCLWQIRGRSNITDFEEWVRLDLAYIDQWSLWLDFKILATTIPVVLFGKGAH